METGIKDRVAIVAAASSGIGLAVAQGLAREGARLAICSRNDGNIERAAISIRGQQHVEVLAQAVDVTSPEQVQRFVENVAQRYGRIDICVTNAGGPPAKGFLSTSTEEWRRMVELSFLSVVSLTRAVLPHMQRNRWGRIITLTSIAVKQPILDLVYSNAVRCSVVGLVKSLANEFGREGILVNNVGPGYTATERLKELADSRAAASGSTSEKMFELWAQGTATGRIAQPEEVADAVVWLASERSSGITGQTILVDQGAYRGL